MRAYSQSIDELFKVDGAAVVLVEELEQVQRLVLGHDDVVVDDSLLKLLVGERAAFVVVQVGPEYGDSLDTGLASFQAGLAELEEDGVFFDVRWCCHYLKKSVKTGSSLGGTRNYKH